MSLPTITGRTVKVGTKSFSAMDEELRQIHARINGEQKIPKGAFTAQQYAKANGVNDNQAYQSCKRAASRGLMECFSLRARCGDGAIRLQRFFRLV